MVLDELYHDANAFTQGLLVHDGELFQSTGLYGKSAIQKLDMKTGEVLLSKHIDPKYFGEGITIWDGELIM